MFIERGTKKYAEPQRGEMSAAKHFTPLELKTWLRHAGYKHSTPNGVIFLSTHALNIKKGAFESYPHFLKSYFDAHAMKRRDALLKGEIKEGKPLSSPFYPCLRSRQKFHKIIALAALPI